ncbi:MAG: XTP/dITP diphosphatase [Desulfuromonas sp.]|nr:XTP/dITP diphosphatase [Desulfuromonas sp.]
MFELVVATRNAGKLREIRHLLEGEGVTVLGLDGFPELPEVVEDGDTFAANAAKKAETIARLTGRPCLADDSGLTVEALGGEPGVHSARYAGSQGDDAANNARLLRELAAVPDARRQAAFCCVMALCRPGLPTTFFEGRVAGRILRAPRGAGGFGYDPLFLVDGFDRTMAELPLAEKNRISHRGQALRQVVAVLAVQPR